LLEPRRRAERALVAVNQGAYVQGISTRKVDDLVRAMGASGVSKSQVSRLCAELDAKLRAFRERPLDAPRYPYLWLDARQAKVREAGRVVPAALLTAIAVNDRGEREVLGCAVAAAESAASWTAFVRSLCERGLHGVRLVTSDAHLGIRAAVGLLDGAAWQRSSVHSDPGPRRSPSRTRAESALAAAIGFEILRQTRASAREASLYRPEGDVPRAPTMSVPGGLRRAARRSQLAGGRTNAVADHGNSPPSIIETPQVSTRAGRTSA
jgi:transposase-like protein